MAYPTVPSMQAEIAVQMPTNNMHQVTASVQRGVLNDMTSFSARDAVNVKDFGATGDGSTDDTTAIQSAIDAAFGPAGSPNGLNWKANRQLYFPPGNYQVSSPLVLTHVMGVRIFGAGRFTTTIDGHTMPDGLAVFRTNGFSYNRISDMQIVGPFLGQCIDQDYDGAPTGVNNQSNTYFNMYFDQATHGCSTGLRIAHGGGTAMGSENLILNCFFVGSADPGQAGLRTQGQNAVQNTVVGGNFQNLDTGILCEGGVVSGIFSVGFQQQRSWDINLFNDIVNICTIQGCRTESANFVTTGLIGLTISGCMQSSAAGPGTFLDIQSGCATVSGCYSQDGQVVLNHGPHLTITNSTFDRSDWIDQNVGNTWSISSGFGSECYTRIENSIIAGGPNIRLMEMLKSNDGLTMYSRQIVSCKLLTDANINGKTFGVGDIVWQNEPAAGASPGWICTTAGTAGTTAVFKAMANLAP